MSLELDAKEGGEEKEEEKSLLLKQDGLELSLETCYNKEWIFWLMGEGEKGEKGEEEEEEERQRKEKHHIFCQICKQVANNALELICSEHESNNEPLIVGEQCLLTYFQKNNINANHPNRICPINNHKRCQYIKGKIIRQQMDNWIVICPRQFQVIYEQKQKNLRMIRGTANIDIEIEGSVNEINEEKSIKDCIFKGKIKDIKDHLNGSCILKPIHCEFKKFGCMSIVYEPYLPQHMKSQIQYHLQLFIQKTEGQNKEINELKSINLFLQKENESLNQNLENLNTQISQLQKAQETQQENKKLNQLIRNFKAQISQLETDNNKLRQKNKTNQASQLKFQNERGVIYKILIIIYNKKMKY